MSIFSNEQKRIVNLMRDGLALCKENTEDGVQYFFSGSSERRPNPSTVMALRNAGIIAPCSDGLFGDHQTFDLVFVPREAL